MEGEQHRKAAEIDENMTEFCSAGNPLQENHHPSNLDQVQPSSGMAQGVANSATLSMGVLCHCSWEDCYHHHTHSLISLLAAPPHPLASVAAGPFHIQLLAAIAATITTCLHPFKRMFPFLGPKTMKS